MINFKASNVSYHLQKFVRFWSCSADLRHFDRMVRQRTRIWWTFSNCQRYSFGRSDSSLSLYCIFASRRLNLGNERTDPKPKFIIDYIYPIITFILITSSTLIIKMVETPTKCINRISKHSIRNSVHLPRCILHCC